jgi:flagellar hook-basal body complex protein FliE
MENMKFEAIPDSAIGLDDAAPRMELLSPGEAEAGASKDGLTKYFNGLVNAFSGARESLDSAQAAESAFLEGKGGLQEMVFERARADSILQVAQATASRTSQALNQVMNMPL